MLPLLALALASTGSVAQLAPVPPTEPKPLEAGAPLEVGVPFACGHAYPVSQGHDTGSHLMNDTWAWDFRMPSGVPITAALPGTVRLARGDSYKGGCDSSFAPDSNYVVVAHDSGLETQYLHFETVTVRAGEKVKAGDILGYSGKTGWACGSHLHFKLARSDGPGWNNPSVRARIKGYGDPSLEMVVKAAACNAPGNAIAAHPPAPSDSAEHPPSSIQSSKAPVSAAAPPASDATAPHRSVAGGTGATN